MKVLVAAVVVVVASVSLADNSYRLSSPYSYTCTNDFCQKKERGQTREYRSLENCQLTCGMYGAIWPKPTGNVQLSEQIIHFNPEHMHLTKTAVSDQEVSEMVDEAYRYFKRNLHFLHHNYPQSKKTPYTENEKVKVNQRNSQGRVSQHRTILNQEGNNQQQQSTSEFETGQTKTYENWERYSPFFKEKYSGGVERQRVKIEITVNTGLRKLRLNTDESYGLDVKTSGDETLIKIQAPTYFGARHALETLSQLIAFDSTNNALMLVKDATVQDTPKFKYRGFMLDTSRNYYPKEDLMSLFDAMSQNKMNYFQWHITDAASFPMYTESRPEMAYYGAYSARKVYYPKDIKEIVEYARVRGISVIPEINSPGHSNAGWQWGQKSGKGQLVLCDGEQQSPWIDLGTEPPAGQLNPVNPEVYNVLGEIYKDTVEYFDPEMVHMGGDSVSFNCWRNSEEIKEYLAASSLEPNDKEMAELWNIFQTRAYNKLVESAGRERHITPIIHSSLLARNYIDKETYIVQLNEFTTDIVIAQYVTDGYKVIFSNLDKWRLDCIATTWVGEYSANCPKEIPTWHQFYGNSPLDVLTRLGVPNTRTGHQNPQQRRIMDNILGGTVSLFSSETDANGFQAKAWPRASAMAERLWSDSTLPPKGKDTTQKRLNIQRQRMVSRGVRAAQTQPEFCFRDESACYSKEEYAARSANIPQQG